MVSRRSGMRGRQKLDSKSRKAVLQEHRPKFFQNDYQNEQAYKNETENEDKGQNYSDTHFQHQTFKDLSAFTRWENPFNEDEEKKRQKLLF